MTSTTDAVTMPADPNANLDDHQAAARIGVSVSTMRRWRKVHSGPPYVKLDHHVRYRPADLDAWMAQRTVHPSR